MGVLDGKEFFSWDIQPVLAYAANTSMNLYSETEDPAWLSTNVNIVSTKVKVNALVDADTSYGAVVTVPIRKGDSLWSEIDAVLTPVAEFQEVKAAIDALPADSGALPAGPDWMRPAVILGACGIVGLISYYWARGK